MKTIRGLKSALAASVTLTCLLHTLTALADE
jgi:hypothetical protein